MKKERSHPAVTLNLTVAKGTPNQVQAWDSFWREIVNGHQKDNVKGGDSNG